MNMWGDRAAKVLREAQYPDTWPYTEEDFSRLDESNDQLFYSQPRLVYHIDEFAIRALTKFYKNNFVPGADILDVCSSWVSHFPEDYKAGFVAGIGLNELELSKNSRLDEYHVIDLQENPTFPYPNDRFDIVTMVVSVDYLIKPLQVFREIGRVLRPGGTAYISFSNRCFPTKAVSIWLASNDMQRVYIVGSFFHYSGMFTTPRAYDLSPNFGITDPLYMVTANKKS
ncbi:hypothetical protein GAYE_PCTG30G0739 [Galdieria yellowstonensis]|uniref:Methyltransferase type 11 domain-containing protein n=1 Tax=Galdieria yellowstonensis TaxID=3028027 RepID=A0AAV9I3R8_9RHOD|nr:hypothetical protein GAYE_PCTG30G0739 [Galdieria yellowstonensis]